MNINEQANFIWSIADLLRGDFKQSEYGKVILPFTVLRRFDCVLAPSKAKILEANKTLTVSNKRPIFKRMTGHDYYSIIVITDRLVLDKQLQESELKRVEKRKAEVDGKFVRMYEDWSAGRITEYNFNLLTKKYQAEQLELEEKISRLQAELSAEQQTALDAEKWVALIKQYANPTELTAELLNTLIEKIVIHEATKGADGMRDQEIEIYYRFIGKID